MSNTTFVDKTTVIEADWLNQVNDHIFSDTPVSGTVVHDASVISFTQNGTGAIARTSEVKHQEIVSVLDYGIVPNDSSSATRTANVAAALALFGPTADGGDTTRTGVVWFPNTTATTYYFNDPIPQRDGIILEGNGCGLDFTKAAYVDTDDDSMGFLYAMRDGAIRNFSLINVDYPGSAGTNSGNVIKIGNRRDEGIYFQNAYDSLYAQPSGNFRVENCKLQSNNPYAAMALLLGGLENVTFDHVELDGQDLAYTGIDGEFGFWDNTGTSYNDKSSHARNLIFRNIVGRNLTGASASVIGLRGVWNVTIDNVVAEDVQSIIAISTGEAANANPGTPDLVGVKRNIRISNITGKEVTGTAIDLSGNTVWTGYLSSLATQAQTNVEIKTTALYDFVLDGFNLSSSGAGGQGVSVSGNNVTLRNGYVTGFSNGIYDIGSRNLVIDTVESYDNTSYGLNHTYSPVYAKSWQDRRAHIINSAFAGNGDGGVAINGPVNALVELNNFGYDRPATGTFTVTAGTVLGSGALNSLTVNAVEILDGPATPVPWGTSHTATATAIAASINAYTGTSGYSAVSNGAVVLIMAALGTGTTPNGYVVVPTVAGDMTVGTLKDMSGGKVESTQNNSVWIGTNASAASVTVRQCRTLKATSTAYVNANTTGVASCYLEKNTGQIDFSGLWLPDEGTFTGTYTGISGADPTGTVKYSVKGRTVTLSIPTFTGTSDTTSKTITGMPAAIWPVATQDGYVSSSNNGGAYVVSRCTISTAGVITLGTAPDSTTWTNSGTAAILPASLTYVLD